MHTCAYVHADAHAPVCEVHMCVHGGQETTSVVILKNAISFETESLTGLEFINMAKLAAQQALTVLLPLPCLAFLHVF